jgi:hypothetical protein
VLLFVVEEQAMRTSKQDSGHLFRGARRLQKIPGTSTTRGTRYLFQATRSAQLMTGNCSVGTRTTRGTHERVSGHLLRGSPRLQKRVVMQMRSVVRNPFFYFFKLFEAGDKRQKTSNR